MRIVAVIALIGLAGSSLCFAQKGKETGAAMKTTMDSVSYAIGLNIAKSLGEDSITLNPDLVRAGLADAMGGKSQRFSDSVAQMVLTNFQMMMMARQQQQMQTDATGQAEINRQKGEVFLKANKGKPGVQTTASGLQYIIQTQGRGDSPDLNDVVTVNYRGTLVDGTEFDKSQPGKPIQFSVDGVIPGWTEALQMMKPGAKWTLFIPSNLAYGESGAGGVIGPNETLVFEVELLSVKKQ